MKIARRFLSRVAVIWLFCHFVTLSVAAFELWPSGNPATCACPLGANAPCPMHHQTAAGPTPCAMKSASHPVSLVVTSFLNIAGCLTPAVPGIDPSLHAAVPAPHSSPVLSRPGSPDLPPPRV